MKLFTHETRTKLADTIRARWAFARELGVVQTSHIFGIGRDGLLPGYKVVENSGERRVVYDLPQPQLNVVKYVADDQVTALIELLRNMMPQDKLIEELQSIGQQIIADTKGKNGQ